MLIKSIIWLHLFFMVKCRDRQTIFILFHFLPKKKDLLWEVVRVKLPLTLNNSFIPGFKTGLFLAKRLSKVQRISNKFFFVMKILKSKMMFYFIFIKFDLFSYSLLLKNLQIQKFSSDDWGQKYFRVEVNSRSVSWRET